MKMLTNVLVTLGLALSVIGTFFVIVMIKAIALGFTVFLLVGTALVIVFFSITVPIYDYFHKENKS